MGCEDREKGWLVGFVLLFFFPLLEIEIERV